MNRILAPLFALALAVLALAGPAAHALPPLCTAPGWCEPEYPDLLCSCLGRPKVVTCGTYPSGCWQALTLPNEKAATCAASVDAMTAPSLELFGQPASN